MVKPMIWDKWCDEACTYWEPTQLAEDFCPRVALVVCYSLPQGQPAGEEDDLPQCSVHSGTLDTTVFW